MSDWMLNEDGHWCTSCGYLVARPEEDEDSLPDECRQCGFPDADQVARYHCYDDEDEQVDEEDQFDCPRFWTPEGWYCPAQGSEDCDWECPHSR